MNQENHTKIHMQTALGKNQPEIFKARRSAAV